MDTSEFTVDKTESLPETGKPLDAARTDASLPELAERFHLFTLGPVYVGARIETDMLEAFAEQEKMQFDAVLSQQPLQMFANLFEWDYLVQGIEKSEDELDLTKDVNMSSKPRVAEQFSQFLMAQEFMNRKTGFYAKMYSRPVIITVPGAARGIPIEVYMLSSNKGTQVLKGENPYIVERDARVNKLVKESADAMFDVLEDV